MDKCASRKRTSLVALLIDVSGTLHVGSTPTLNATDAFYRLRQSPIPYRLCSNTSKESTGALVKRLKDMGFGISEVCGETDEPKLVWTSIGAVAQTLKNMGLRKPYTLLSDSARQEVLDANNYFPVDHCLGDISQDARFDSVVIGLSPSHFDYPNLNSAFRILKDDAYREASTDGDSYTENFGVDVPISHRRHIPLIATHKARYIETESGLSLGPGPFVTALENAAATTAHVVGKPTKAFFETVIQDFTTHELEAATRFTKADEEISARDRIAVIGDDVEADLGEGAIELGLWRVLVKTGKYRAGDENKPGVVPPDEVFDSFAAFVDSLLQTGKGTDA